MQREEAATSATPPKIPMSSNKSGGFLTVMGKQAISAWPLAVLTIAVLMKVTDEEARDFLESSYGSAFARDVLDELGETRRGMNAAIMSVTVLWMSRPAPANAAPYLRDLIRRVSICRKCTNRLESGMLCSLADEPCDPGLERWRGK